MELVFLDFETFWSDKHSLTKMSPIEYVMHPETEIISLAAKFGKGETRCIFGEDNIKSVCSRIDWSDKYVIAHNNEGFDSMILAWRLGIRPAMWGCTLAMARPIHAKGAGGSLKALAAHYGVGSKDSSALLNTKGRHLKDFTTEEIAAMKQYNIEDVDMCAAIFKKLKPHTSLPELRLIDMTIRMLVEPKFQVDQAALTDALIDELARKQAVLMQLVDLLGLPEGTPPEDVSKTLGSAAKFKELLRTLGVETPMKISPTTGAPTPALAKTDEGFIALKEHDNPLVAAAAMARLDVKSTLLSTRVQAFLDAAQATGGTLPIPLKYYGADTTGRWSGWAYNPQNLPRVSGDKPSNVLRMCMRAPTCYNVVVSDLSGIELRVNHFLWKSPSSMALFQADPEKADLYKDFASKLYTVDVGAVTKAQRQVGKVAHLGLGFGAGAVTFQSVAKLMGGVDLSLAESAEVVATWRAAYPEIVKGWRTSHRALDAIYAGERMDIDPWGLCHTTAEGIATPKGLIRYPKLHKETDDEGKTEWVYGEGRRKARIYAGKVVENIVQHLARNVIADQALQIQSALGLTPALMVHDELVYVVPEADAPGTLDAVNAIMRTPPAWWPELVTWSEGDIAASYGAAK